MPAQDMPTEEAHSVALDFHGPAPESVDLGARFALTLAIETDTGDDLTGATYELRDGETLVASGVLPPIERRDADAEDYDPRNGPIDWRDSVRMELVAPRTIGVHTWTFVLPAQQIGGCTFADAQLDFTFTTAEHRTSLAAWDAPSPVETGQAFSLKVGAKCSACCALGGRRIEMRDEAGCVIATGELTDAIWPGAEGLYWCELAATAPLTQGLQSCTIAFSACDLELPHSSATTSVSFMTTAPARHRVAVRIVEKETRAPIADAQVRLGDHRGASDETGVARFMAPDGEQSLFIWKAGYDAPERMVTVTGDVEITVDAEILPQTDPYSRWDG